MFGRCGFLPFTWEPARPLQGSLGAEGPEMPKKSRKCLENVSKMSSGPGTPTSLQKVSGTVRKDSFDTFRRLSGDFPDRSRDFLETFRGPGAGGPGRHFRDFFGISGPKGPRDLCKGRAGSQPFTLQGRNNLKDVHFVRAFLGLLPSESKWLQLGFRLPGTRPEFLFFPENR